jgi:trehalose 6-phosphate phosphatase
VSYALSTLGLERLRGFVTPRSLLAFDVDGTLAPIVARPWDARIPSDLQRRLAAFTKKSTVAIITGRAVDDARPMLEFNPAYLIGNHGCEGLPGFESATSIYASECAQWLDELRAEGEAWRDTPGVTLEDKTYSLTFHYRHAARRDAALRTLEARAAELSPLPRVIHGDCVLNLVPREAPHKGDALLELLEHSGCEHALYVGDDTTDEDVFRLDIPELLSVRVHQSDDTAAELYLHGQVDVVRLLDAIDKFMESARVADTPGRR